MSSGIAAIALACALSVGPLDSTGQWNTSSVIAVCTQTRTANARSVATIGAEHEADMTLSARNVQPTSRWEDYQHYSTGRSLESVADWNDGALVCENCEGRGRWWDDTYDLVTCADCEGAGFLPDK